MKYGRTCIASCMFVGYDAMSFNEILRNSLYNFKQRVTKSNNIIVNHVYQFTRATSKSGRTLIVYCILCKYFYCMCIGPIHLLAMM